MESKAVSFFFRGSPEHVQIFSYSACCLGISAWISSSGKNIAVWFRIRLLDATKSYGNESISMPLQGFSPPKNLRPIL